jgi:hypothetical protein
MICFKTLQILQIFCNITCVFEHQEQTNGLERFKCYETLKIFWTALKCLYISVPIKCFAALQMF